MVFFDECHLCVVSLSSPPKSSFSSVLFDFNASLNDFAPLFPMLLPVDLMSMEKSGLLMEVTCVLFLLSSRLRVSFVIVVFVFNASLNDVAPVSPIWFSVDSAKKKEWIVDGCHLCCSFCLHHSD